MPFRDDTWARCFRLQPSRLQPCFERPIADGTAAAQPAAATLPSAPQTRPRLHDEAHDNGGRHLQPNLSRRTLLLGAAFSTSAFQRSAYAQTGNVSTLRATFAKLVKWAERNRVALGAAVLDVASGQPILSSAESSPLNPASNQKLLTMAAALDRLGPAFRFSTSLHGRLTGDTLSELVLRGNGDPELTVTRLERMVRALYEQGVRRITGDVFVDQSAFDSQWEPPAYDQRPNDSAAYRAPVSAVAVDGNLLVLHVVPSGPPAGGQPPNGTPARLWLEPPGLADIEGSVATLERGPADVSFSVQHKAGKLVARVGGSVLFSRGEVSFSRRLPDPEIAAGRVLWRLLEEHRIAIGGALRAGGKEVRSELVALRSRALGELLLPLGKQSDNFAAEMLLKALGAQASGQTQGSSQAGARVLVDYLQKNGAFLPGTSVTNGSGLFDANRVTALGLARVLREVYLDPRCGPEFLAALAIGGTDGTLSRRLAPLAASRRVRAKTGTLSDVVALSGYVLSPTPGAARCFSLLLNGVAGRQMEAKDQMDQVVLALANESG